ncbi:transcription factor kayak isoform X2 [Phlebotomus argentipes]|uniref:transcription factor kayak isoform X2 n=1 Tax=Phlebotomus argentipes TaxID=94469 RepID=UPI002892E9D2|nr:transcription factor kayak isoform X2 [Phlebotomus argentipes]
MKLEPCDADISGSSDNSQNSSDIVIRQDISLVSLDGIHSGVPTRTTATLTPTTLRNIEQTFIELSSETPSSVPCQAGFVPPLAPFPFEQDHNSLGSSGSGSNSSWHTPPPTISEDLISSVSQGSSSDGAATTASSGNNSKATPAPRRNMGGRRPAKACNLSPEEEEKRKIRRERNKLAAARCRKRRVDHTNELTDEVNGLEKKKQDLQSDIQALQQQKEELEFLLESHRAHCRLKGRSCSPLDVKPHATMLELCDRIKSEPVDVDGPPSPKRVLLSQAANPDVIILPPITSSAGMAKPVRPNRPSSLNVPLTMTPSQVLGVSVSGKSVTEFAGVPITTPSNGMFNFDSLMDGGTGLTPVSAPLQPNCSVQKSPLELATPTSEPSKLVSL